MNQKRKWTCVLDFRGGTYVRQTWAASPEKAFSAALKRIAKGEVAHLKPEALKEVVERVADQGGDPVPLKGMRGVFCATVRVGKHLMMAHIIETASRRREG